MDSAEMIWIHASLRIGDCYPPMGLLEMMERQPVEDRLIWLPKLLDDLRHKQSQFDHAVEQVHEMIRSARLELKELHDAQKEL